MKTNVSLISYTLAAMASMCFLSGLYILTNEGEKADGQTGSNTINVGELIK